MRGRPGAILAVEGGDFLEGKIDRVPEAHARGVRSIQLVHYRVNELGDIQTEAPLHGGLTPFGQDVIREMNRVGLVVDVAHLTLDGVRAGGRGRAEAPASCPTRCWRHRLRDAPSREHARLVADNGGVIGIFPVNSRLPRALRLRRPHRADDRGVGVDHVGVGTDMDGISPPSFVAKDDYADWPSVPAALLARGHSREDVAKVVGGNFLRLYREVTA